MARKTRLTHTGTIEGCDRRTSDGYRKEIPFRETKLHWVDHCGRKFSKARDGFMIGEWPMYRLDLESVRPVGGAGGR